MVRNSAREPIGILPRVRHGWHGVRVRSHPKLLYPLMLNKIPSVVDVCAAITSPDERHNMDYHSPPTTDCLPIFFLFYVSPPFFSIAEFCVRVKHM